MRSTLLNTSDRSASPPHSQPDDNGAGTLGIAVSSRSLNASLVVGVRASQPFGHTKPFREANPTTTFGHDGEVLFTKTFTAAQYAEALHSWAWAGLSGKQPVLSSLFGDTFLHDGDGVWYLDIVGGTLQLRWPDAVALHADLETPHGQDEYLLSGLALAAVEQGISLGPDQVYDFNPTPVLGGPIQVSSLSATDFVVAVNIAGQIHEQVRDLPPGTRVASATVDHEPPKGVWKFWQGRR